ncbi:MAG: hypothetical protein HND50_22310 [Calditrichaeota bacterium]|nr:hypothetical protein [Calditrichota bacterium]
MKIIKILFILSLTTLFAQDVDSSSKWSQESINLQKQAMQMSFDNVFETGSKRIKVIDSALVLLDRSYKIDTTYYHALTSQIGLYQEKKDYELALTTMKEVLKLKPDFAEVEFGLGMQYDFLKHKEDAKRHYLKALDLYKERLNQKKYSDINNHFHIGLCLVLLGKEKEGKEYIYKFNGNQEMDEFIEMFDVKNLTRSSLLKSFYK